MKPRFQADNDLRERFGEVCLDVNLRSIFEVLRPRNSMGFPTTKSWDSPLLKAAYSYRTMQTPCRVTSIDSLRKATEVQD